MHKDATPTWGLRRDITPCFGARLVQEGHRLHFLADRAGFTGSFSEVQTLQWMKPSRILSRIWS